MKRGADNTPTQINGSPRLVMEARGLVKRYGQVTALDGNVIHFKSPVDARREGIETVYQDLAVAPAMAIAENLFLGSEIIKPGFLGRLLRIVNPKTISMSDTVAVMTGAKRPDELPAEALA